MSCPILRSEPARQVYGWLNRHRARGLFTTAVSVGELLYGISLLPTGRRKAGLRAQVENLLAIGFRDRVMDYDSDAARSYATLAADRQQAGRTLPTADAQIATICLVQGARLATRNTRDFQGTGITVVNPWEDA